MVANFCWFISIRSHSSISANQNHITSHNHVQYHCSLRTSSAQSAEVLGRLGDSITTEFHDDATSGLSTDGDVEINLRGGPWRRGVQREKDSTIKARRSMLCFDSTALGSSQ
jgi:hypothetical protein